MENELRGKIAIITGASRGIGHELAMEFARQGRGFWRERHPAGGARCAESGGGGPGPRCVCVTGSVAEAETAQRIVTPARLDAYGRIDILVNNAGINNRKKTWSSPWRTGTV